MEERDPNAMSCPAGYLIHLYCCRMGCSSEAEAVADGYYAYSQARANARKQGWILHSDGFATCPKCSGKNKKK